MAKQRFTLPTTNDTIRNVILGPDDRELDTFVTRSTTEVMDDGSISTEKTATSRIMADGSGFNPAMLMGSRPERIGSCHFCEKKSRRRRRAHRSSLVNLKFASFCSTCGRLGCRNHVRRSSGDGQPRCWWCNLKYRIKRAAKPLFYRLEYEELSYE